MEENKKPKIAFALGGGGALGIAHIGALQVLHEAGIEPSLVVGTSVGACMGAYYALGHDLKKLEDEVVRASHRWALRQLIDVSLLRGALLKGKKLESFLIRLVGDQPFSKTKMPVIAIATDLATGDAVVLRRGRLIPALLASSAVPGIFPAVKMGKKYLIDGGVVCPTPIEYALAEKPDLVIGIDLFYRRNIKLDRQPKLAETLTLAYEIMRTQGDLARTCVASPKVICIKPEFKQLNVVSNFRFDDGMAYIKAGRKAATEALPYIKEKLAILAKDNRVGVVKNG
ncbi:MAG: patatin-like phospholipase family protein [Candidatus Falkowbacteria bacterium]